MKKLRSLLALGLFIFIACSSGRSSNMIEVLGRSNNIIIGEITYNSDEELATPYTVVVELQEMSDEGNSVLELTEFTEEENDTINYQLAYDPAVLDDTKSYIVAVRILDSDGVVIAKSITGVNPFVSDDKIANIEVVAVEEPADEEIIALE